MLFPYSRYNQLNCQKVIFLIVRKVRMTREFVQTLNKLLNDIQRVKMQTIKMAAYNNFTSSGDL